MSNQIYPGLDEFNVEFSLYGGCRVNCSYCPHLEIAKRVDSKKLTLENFKKIIDVIPKNVGVGFSGMVEPLLHPDFYNMVEYVKIKGNKLICCSTLPSDYLKNIECFLDDRIWSYRSVHLRDEFMSYKKEDKEYYKSLEVYFNSVVKDKTKNEIYYHTKKLDSYVVELINKHGLKNNVTFVEPYKRIDAPIKYKANDNRLKKGKIKCSHNHHKVTHILPDGDAVLCCMDVQKNHVLGNLLSSEYVTILQSNEYRKVLTGFEDESLNTICRYCVFAEEI